MLQISQRPLTGSDEDRKLFVGRSSELGHLARAAELNFNVLVLGERGIGMTSLMHQHHRHLEDHNRVSYYARAAKAETLVDLLNVIRIAIEGPRRPTLLGLGGEHPLQGMMAGGDSDPLQVLKGLITAEVRSTPYRPTIILDELHRPELAHELFGRHRDDLWNLPFRWVVCGLSTKRQRYLEPPADSFFDTTLTLAPCDETTSAELLNVRLGQAGNDHVEAQLRITAERGPIVVRGMGNPRRILAAARAVVVQTPEESLNGDRLTAVAAELGQTEKRAFRHLLLNGPTSPSDPTILEELEVTRARANQVLRHLEKAGLVSTFQDRQGVGRPRKLYAARIGSAEAV